MQKKKKKRFFCSFPVGLFTSPQSALYYVSQLVTKQSQPNAGCFLDLSQLTWR